MEELRKYAFVNLEAASYWQLPVPTRIVCIANCFLVKSPNASIDFSLPSAYLPPRTKRESHQFVFINEPFIYVKFSSTIQYYDC